MADVSESRAALQSTMIFLGAVASGIELAIGESATSISYLAGQQLGVQLSAQVARTTSIEAALSSLQQVLAANGCLWQFEPFQPHGCEQLIETTADGESIQLVFRDCMIRQTLFCYGHHQQGSLCNMMNGFFAGALQNIMDCESTLDILHPGENACLKRLTIRRRQQP